MSMKMMHIMMTDTMTTVADGYAFCGTTGIMAFTKNNILQQAVDPA